MKKKLSYLFVILGLLGFLTLIPGFFDSALYYYLRIAKGSTMHLNSKCFSVPNEWVIDSFVYREGSGIYTLRKKDNNKYTFASVFHGAPSLISSTKNSVPIFSNGDLFSIYELTKLDKNNSVKYWSLVPYNDLIIMGRSTKVLKALSLEIQSSDC